MGRIRRRKLRVVWNLLIVSILLSIAAALGILTATLLSISKMLPTKEIDITRLSEATNIYSSEGVLLARIYEENRQFVPITEIPKVLQDATVAIEDERFYDHAGVDAKAILRALVQNIRGGRYVQGGSTITQQLARTIYLSQRKTLSRKLQEAVLAHEIERRLSKQEIL
ncbi:MAG: biosynthetic peptidoglycan transglycosylase, partial [Armatimonadota bacterium]|nr:biosynthetic peptidoglycan transglycosylase [Armatimonadota bacterium]